MSGSEGWGQSHAQPWGLSLGFGELLVPIDLVDLQSSAGGGGGRW